MVFRELETIDNQTSAIDSAMNMPVLPRRANGGPATRYKGSLTKVPNRETGAALIIALASGKHKR